MYQLHHFSVQSHSRMAYCILVFAIAVVAVVHGSSSIAGKKERDKVTSRASIDLSGGKDAFRMEVPSAEGVGARRVDRIRRPGRYRRRRQSEVSPHPCTRRSPRSSPLSAPSGSVLIGHPPTAAPPPRWTRAGSTTGPTGTGRSGARDTWETARTRRLR